MTPRYEGVTVRSQLQLKVYRLIQAPLVADEENADGSPVSLHDGICGQRSGKRDQAHISSAIRQDPLHSLLDAKGKIVLRRERLGTREDAARLVLNQHRIRVGAPRVNA